MIQNHQISYLHSYLSYLWSSLDISSTVRLRRTIFNLLTMKELDALLHSQLRLAIMSILLSAEEADFVYLKEKTESTAGNLSVQIDKLSAAGYITKETDNSGTKPRTICRMTEVGRSAMHSYMESLKSYFMGL